jgi:dTDP-4-dehydrorhamnose reductase
MINKKILITGSGGMLGSAFMVNENIGIKIPAPSNVMDVTDFEKTKEFLKKYEPDIIVHCAALTDVEKCEIDRDSAFRTNTIGTENLVNASMSLDKEPIFCFISSIGVYGAHKKEPYTEFDNVFPTTIHHLSKLEAEKIIMAHIKKYLIIRAGWLFGGDATQPKNFVYKRYLEACNSKLIYANNTQVGNPAFTEDVVKQVFYLLERECFGIFNCVGGSSATRYEYVKSIIELFGLPCEVNIAGKDSFKRIAPVSDNESAVNYKLGLVGLDIMPDWKESLAGYIERLKRDLNA